MGSGREVSAKRTGGEEAADQESGHLGELLRQLRIADGLSQNGLASRAGIAASTLSRWESGATLPRVTELESVLGVLKASRLQSRRALMLIGAPRAARRLRASPGDTLPSRADAPNAPTSSLSPPLGGDLLRALRRRRGMTQADVAAIVGVPQNAIARWERSDSWPDATRLHRLCYCLEARPEEIAALTVGRFSLTNLLEVNDPADLHVEQWRLWAATLSDSDEALKDLRFLALEGRLHYLLTSPESGTNARREHLQRILSWTYSRHAQYLRQMRRYAEATAPARFALTLQKQVWRTRDDEGWVPAILALALAEVRSNEIRTETSRSQSPGEATGPVSAAMEAETDGRTKRAHSRCLGMLRGVLETVRSDAYRSWVLSDMARHSLMAGQKEAAMAHSAEALRIVEDSDGPSIQSEQRLRRRDHAGTLLAAGRITDASSYVPGLIAGTGVRSANSTIEDLLMGAEILRAMRDSTAANAALSRVHALLGPGQSCQKPVRELTTRFFRTPGDLQRDRAARLAAKL